MATIAQLKPTKNEGAAPDPEKLLQGAPGKREEPLTFKPAGLALAAVVGGLGKLPRE